MVDYVSLRAVAEKLIDTNGRDVTLRRLNRTAANPSEPWRGPGAGVPTENTVRAAIFNFLETEVDGELVQRGDKQAFIAASAAEDAGVTQVEKDDMIIDPEDETDYQIVQVDTIVPGPLRVLYIAQLRK